jgi:hypothetical protein
MPTPLTAQHGLRPAEPCTASPDQGATYPIPLTLGALQTIPDRRVEDAANGIFERRFWGWRFVDR